METTDKFRSLRIHRGGKGKPLLNQGLPQNVSIERDKSARDYCRECQRAVRRLRGEEEIVRCSVYQTCSLGCLDRQLRSIN